ncbi:MAG: hypothetical protein FJW31_22500 [Acidobacteria bacterium]|nr:hypothetical protein [Acidobacteriota bacterium]
MPWGRIAILAAATVIVFGTVAAVLMILIPAPRKETDDLVIGTLATFASLATLFGVMVTTVFQDANALFTRRKKE